MREAVKRLLRPRTLGLRPRTTPVSSHWGYDRGTPIDRWYIERFLERHRSAIRGRVLEVKDDGYARRFGSDLEAVDVLDVDAANERATIVADLACADAVPDSTFDCFVLTQTLQYVEDVPGALRHAQRMLRPGGTLLLTVPTLGKMVVGRPHLVDRWRFAPASCATLVEDAFAHPADEVTVYGNAVASAAFLLGYAVEDLWPAERDAVDPAFPLLVAVRATKA